MKPLPSLFDQPYFRLDIFESPSTTSVNSFHFSFATAYHLSLTVERAFLKDVRSSCIYNSFSVALALLFHNVKFVRWSKAFILFICLYSYSYNFPLLLYNRKAFCCTFLSLFFFTLFYRFDCLPQRYPPICVVSELMKRNNKDFLEFHR